MIMMTGNEKKTSERERERKKTNMLKLPVNDSRCKNQEETSSFLFLIYHRKKIDPHLEKKSRD